MRQAVAYAAVLSITGCLAAPRESGDRADPDGGGGGTIGGDPSGGDGEDGGAAVPCASGVELAYVSSLCAPPGMANVSVYGLALFVNRGGDPVDLSGVHIEDVSTSSVLASAALAVHDDGVVIPAGEAHGVLWQDYEEEVLFEVSEPWTSRVTPAMSGSFSHDLEDGSSYVITAMVRAGDLQVPISIEVVVLEGASWEPFEATRVTAECLPDA